LSSTFECPLDLFLILESCFDKFLSLGAFADFRKESVSFMSVCLSRLSGEQLGRHHVCLSLCPRNSWAAIMSVCLPPLDGLSLNLMFEYFFKICRGSSSCIETWQ